MQREITPDDIQRQPELAATTVRLRSGEDVSCRPLAPQDRLALGEYFRGLSPATTDLFGPHRFDQETADKLCAEIDHSTMLRMVGVTSDGARDRIVAYFLLYFGVRQGDIDRYRRVNIELDPATDAVIAPSVADSYQNQGMGSQLFQHLIDVARRAGRRKLILMGGVRSINLRGIHFYKKHGFRPVGEFESRGNNYDMMLDL